MVPDKVLVKLANGLVNQGIRVESHRSQKKLLIQILRSIIL